MRYALGIDIGASSVKLAAVELAGEGACELRATWRRPHQGAPLPCLAGLLAQMRAELGEATCVGVAATGSGCETLADLRAGTPALQTVPALTEGARLLAPQARSVIEIGAQSAHFLCGLGGQGAPQFAMNESCAAGTGSFFEDQMHRLGLPIERYSELVRTATGAPRISGRCAVFAKSDIIHRQQEGAPVQDILMGLCVAMAKSYKATIVRSLPVEAPVALTGGTTLNEGVVRAMREVFGLEGDDLAVSEHACCLQAAGAACAAVRGELGASEGDLARLERALAQAGFADGASGAQAAEQALAASAERLPRLAPLPPTPPSDERGFALRPDSLPAVGEAPEPVALGVDVGSTSTNLVLLDARGQIVDAQYLRTRGDARAVVREGLASLGERLGERVHVVAVATTGSGRTMIGEMIGADVVRDEITAQARAAVAADPQVTTVFEIGGQDSKYVSLRDGQVVDFQMNKICAAGTGSFVEEQAARLGIGLAQIGPCALSASSPVDLGERCTVFVETAINAALAAGASKPDVAAGLCLSVARNYLHRVVGSKPVGERVVLQGGVAYNPGIVGAFRAECGEGLTVSPWFAVSGAVGAALLASEARGFGTAAGDAALIPESPSAFKGFDLAGTGAARPQADPQEVSLNRAFFARTDEMLFEGYAGELDPAKKTVGVPLALMVHKLFPLLNGFFTHLGFNVLASPYTTDEIVQLSQQTAQGETCYPVKLVHGHMAWLARRGVDYIFMPRMHTVRHVMSSVAHNYACPYMQVSPELAAEALHLEERGITLLDPLLDMDFGQSALATALLGVGTQLGCTPQESARAILAGSQAMTQFVARTEQMGDDLLASLQPGQRVLVLMTRQYGISDPALNMGIPQALLDRGEKVITISHLRAHNVDLSADYPGLFWPFGQHMVSATKLIARDPRLFAVYLTNHGCGPDTMVSHLVAEEMGDKPYLQIETDEHSSAVGVLTRVEAFLNAIDHYQGRDERTRPLCTRPVEGPRARLAPGVAVELPGVGAFGELAGAWLAGEGRDVRVRPLDAAGVELARTKTTSKEYLSFAAMLGCALGAAAEARETGRPVQLALPATMGAEADGAYDRVIDSVLHADGARGVRVVAPHLERLPQTLGCAPGAAGSQAAGGVQGAGSSQDAGAARRSQDEAAPSAGTSRAAGLWGALLAGDVAYALPPEARAAFVAQACERARAGAGALDAAWVLATARKAAAQLAEPQDDRALGVVGEWPCVFSDELANGTWDWLEEQGWRLARMPLSEYLWLLWSDALDASAQKRDTARTFLDGPEGPLPGILGEVDLGCDCGHGHASHAGGCSADACASCGSYTGEAQVPEGMADVASGASARAAEAAEAVARWVAEQAPAESSAEEARAFLDACAAQMAELHVALGQRSPFAASLEELRAEADRTVGRFTAANARYRQAKAALLARSGALRGVICAASMYENAGITMDLLRERPREGDVPTLRLFFDGALDQSMREKLRTFLYYL